MSLYKPKNVFSKGIPEIMDAFVVLVKTEWNADVVDELEKGCINMLNTFGVRHQTIIVPGAFEIPFAIRNYHQSVNHQPDAYIALGCVIKGDTPHFEYVCQAVTQGVLQLNLTLDAPSVFGVLTVNNMEQAQERIGGKHGHKGEEAAQTALKMIKLSNSIA